MNNLSHYNWIEPWDYLKKELVVNPCTDPTFVLDKTYNVCIHTDCVLYPFLSLTNLKIGLRDKSECVYDAFKNQIDKQPAERPYLFWSQRQVPELNSHFVDSCKPNKQVQSGYFIKDSTLYATCDEKQPFVFCPSSITAGTNKHMNSGRFYGFPMFYNVEIPPNTKREFSKNELASVQRKSENVISAVNVNGKIRQIPRHAGIDLTNEKKVIKLETLSQPVRVYFQYMVTYPPDTVYRYDYTRQSGFVDVSPQNHNSFLMKLANFTQKPLALPKYKVESSVPQSVM
ncbi:hypothetical protein JTE90_016314 [Oedothorax gibbosus]|uniref:Vitellogenin n=1 Tax=Oedothorax gibbosus TaxID=931172 RepID=A0AAV6TQY7_9ARAC|nr:hypothetical protein JTE90_016314 [Oedothorax gibbosus]